MRLILEFIIVFIVLYIVNKLLFTKKVKKGKKNKDKMRPEIMYLVTLYKLDIKKIDINKLRNKLIVLWIINIATILIAISLVYHRINVYAINDNDYACFRWTFVYVNAITIFLTLKYLFSKIRLPHSIEWGIKQVSSCTFGIYLIHLLILNIIPDKYKYNTGILHFVFSIIVFLICFLIIRLIKFIPIIKKYL